MDEYIKEFIEDKFNFTVKKEYLFHELCGFTFVFKRHFAWLENQVSSAEIKPVGIIYEENGEFYYAPLHGMYEIADIVREYVNITSGTDHDEMD